MKKAYPKKSTAKLASKLESIFAETSLSKIVIADECGDTLWDDILKLDENKMPSETEKQNKNPCEDLNQLNDK